jgi:hypothetical protein
MTSAAEMSGEQDVDVSCSKYSRLVINVCALVPLSSMTGTSDPWQVHIAIQLLDRARY